MTTTATIAVALERLYARVRVILTAAVTWLVVLAAVVTIALEELQLAGAPGDVLRILGSILTVLGVAIAIVRRVTPVLPNARGILDTGQPRTDLEAIGAMFVADALDPSSSPASDPSPSSTSDGSVAEQYPGEFA